MKFAAASVALISGIVLSGCQGGAVPSTTAGPETDPSGSSAPTISYNGPSPVTASGKISVAVSGSDADAGDTLTYAVVLGPNPKSSGTATLKDSSKGIIDFEPASGWSGQANFTVGVIDSDGHASTVQIKVNVVTPNCTTLQPTYSPQAIRLTGTRPFIINVQPGTSTTGACSGGVGIALEDDTKALGISGSTRAFAAATTFTYSMSSNPSYGTAKLDSQTGALTYTPSGVQGIDNFAVAVTDASGNKGSVNVRVTNGANQSPTLTLSAPTWDAATRKASIQATVVDPDMNDTATLSIVGAPSLGKATLDTSANRISYAANAGATGKDSVTVKVIDASNASASATATIDLGGEANRPPAPTAQPNPANLKSGKSIDVTIAANDPDLADASTLGYTISVVPKKGTAMFKPNSNVLTYTSNGLTGTDNLEVTVTDKGGLTGKITVNFSITSSNSAPVPTATPSSFTVAANSTTAVAMQIAPNDPDIGDTHIYNFSVLPQKGIARVSAGGLVTYTPTSGASGTDSFSIAVTDTNGAVGTVQINGTITGGTSNGDPAKGQTAYNTNCAVCHQAVIDGKWKIKTATSASVIQNALNKVAEMGGVNVTSTQMTDIAAYVRKQLGI